ncbi:MAG: flagellar hook-basal body complex protein, partial [Spirochaetaceae bacterium]
EFTKSTAEDVTNQWDVRVLLDGQEPQAKVGENNGNNTFIMKFDERGRVLSVTDSAGQTLGEGDINVNIQHDIPGAQRLNFALKLGTSGQLNGVTQEANTTTTKAREQDGYTLGYLEDFQIDESGVITGVYSNGVRRELGQMALATFTNPSGLEKAGETNFVVSNNSGAAIVGASGTEGKGTIKSGTLEMSNVDLTEQFVDMIVTQRGFQANSRSITTSDQMLQEILSLKR